MFKLILVFLILVGGFTLAGKYAPQMLGMHLLTLGGFTLTGGIALIILLVYVGFKCVSA
jgi:hypothetical protein